MKQKDSSHSPRGQQDMKSIVESHTPELISKRLEEVQKPSILKDFVYGAIDGVVTTFAIVAGVTGAGLSPKIILILGVANLIGDGFSMAVSNYQATKSESELHERYRKIEEDHIRKYPEGEKEEIRQIFKKKGFKDEALNHIVETITSDKNIWIQTMLTEEFGLQNIKMQPSKAAWVTFLSFIAVGGLPLGVYVFIIIWPDVFLSNQPFFWSALLASICFFSIGAIKGKIVSKSSIRSGLETLLLGGTASALAFYIAHLLKELTS
jgi:VIT1/CCC1 family predicted Fe2+/Mn2+ transporter